MDNEKKLEGMMGEGLEYAETNLSSSDGEEQAKERKKENVRKKRNDRQNQDKEKDKETEKEDNEKEKGKEVERPEKKQRVGKKTSSVCDHYTMFPNCDHKKAMAACNYCGTDYATDTKLNEIMGTCGEKISEERAGVILVKHIVLLTTDCWTSIQNISYLCLTTHWVNDNWKMQKRIINFIQVPSHKGDLVGKELINCLNEWGISSVFAVTIDNASSNDVALRKLKGHLLDKDNTIPLNGEMFHMRCSAHILNLIVTDGLKEFNDAISSI
ncbi:zinc finger BED domain-containing protein DAYSLEEPER-like [Humulus lupulus]|uniref:zinc finger BED domain-containing protein DAYSLEEPER-like n=1 Tax=Humulus lupulus TaxID=3486 RepID=UPI002B413816|nr:zinc finger BED domain-containing protein DAYSLEEPER-like [Humulus lupulus]